MKPIHLVIEQRFETMAHTILMMVNYRSWVRIFISEGKIIEMYSTTFGGRMVNRCFESIHEEMFQSNRMFLRRILPDLISYIGI